MRCKSSLLLVSASVLASLTLVGCDNGPPPKPIDPVKTRVPDPAPPQVDKDMPGDPPAAGSYTPPATPAPAAPAKPK